MNRKVTCHAGYLFIFLGNIVCLIQSHGVLAANLNQSSDKQAVEEVQLSPTGTDISYIQRIGGVTMLLVADSKVLANTRPVTVWNKSMTAARWSDDGSAIVVERILSPGRYVLQVFPTRDQGQAWLSVTGKVQDLLGFGLKDNEVFALERASGGLQLLRYSLFCHCQRGEALEVGSGESTARAAPTFWPRLLQKVYSAEGGGAAESNQPNAGATLVGYRERDGSWHPADEEFALDFAILKAKGFEHAKIIEVSPDATIWLVDNGVGKPAQRYAVYYRGEKRLVLPFDPSDSGSTLNKLY